MLKFFNNKSKGWLTTEQYIFLYCLMVSFAFWILIKLSNHYSITLTIPVKYVEIPKDRFLSQQIDSTITVKIEGQGLELIGEKYFTSKTPVSIPLDRIPIHSHRYSFSKYVLIRDIPNLLFQEKSLSLHQAVVLTDTLSFVLENSHRKTVPIVPDLKYTFKKQYGLYDSIQLNPDSVVLSGPHSIISNIKEINTKKITLKELSSDQHIDTELVIPFSTQLSSSTDQTSIYIPVQKYTEENIEVPIRGENDVAIKFFPSSAKLTLQVAIKDYKRIKADQFEVAAQKDPNTSNKANLVLKKSPSFVKVKKISPENVEYLILK